MINILFEPERNFMFTISYAYADGMEVIYRVFEDPSPQHTLVKITLTISFGYYNITCDADSLNKLEVF